jgi:hypothetical protein
MPLNSSKSERSRTLAPRVNTHLARKFLYELANLRSDQDAAQRFTKISGKLYLSEVPTSLVQQWAIQGEEEGIADLSAEQRLLQYWLLPLRDYVRHLWVRDARAKHWGIFIIPERFFGVGFRGPSIGPWTSDSQWLQGQELPSESSCEQVFTHLANCTAVCRNSECSSPYFFASRRGQKYCSADCARPAQREFKNNWWREYGSARRAARISTKRRHATKFKGKKT